MNNLLLPPVSTARRTTAALLAAVLALAAMVVFAQQTSAPAQATPVTVSWLQWTPPASYGLTGTQGSAYSYAPQTTASAVLPNGDTVYVEFTGEIVDPGNNPTAAGFGGPSGFSANATARADFWSQVPDTGSGASFLSANVPTLSALQGDHIGLIGSSSGGMATQTLRFFSDAAMTAPTSVSNFVMLVASLGNPSNLGEWAFTQDFVVLSDNANVRSGAGLVRATSGSNFVLRGNEGGGAIQFLGTFSQFTWTVQVPEVWATWNLGVSSASPPVPAVTADRPTTTGLINVAMPSVTVAGTDFFGAVTYAVQSGTLPPGLTLNPTTGVISGTPTEPGTSTVVISGTGAGSGFATTTLTFDFSVPLPPALAPLVTTPVAPSTTVAPPATTVAPPATTAPTVPTTTLPPVPVREPSGALPTAAPGSGVVTEDGVSLPVEAFLENDQAFVVRGQDFELRLAGNCTVGCTIVADSNGRETLLVDRNGQARVGGFGFKPGTLVHVWIFSEPQYLGALLVDANGDFAGSFALEGIAVGEHTLQVNGISFDDQARTANLGIIVGDATAPAPQPGVLPATGTSTGPMVFLAALLLAAAGLVGVARRRLGVVAPR